MYEPQPGQQPSYPTPEQYPGYPAASPYPPGPTQPAYSPGFAGPPAPAKRSSRLVVALLTAVVVAIGALVTCAVLGSKVYQQSQSAARQHAAAANAEEARKAAVEFAKLLTEIDYRTIDDNFAKILDGATGQFKENYEKSSQSLKQLLINGKSVATATVVDSAVQSHTDTRVVVLLFVDQKASNLAGQNEKLDKSRLKMTMEKVGDRWLTSNLELP